MKDSQADLAVIRDIATFLERRAGLAFPDSDLGALARKVEERAREVGAFPVTAYWELLHSMRGEEELKALLACVTINETFFFRVPGHFRVISQEVLPYLSTARADIRTLRIWSAGCSSGEETYSLAMCILDSGLFNGWNTEVVGTDISVAALDKAQKATYRGRTLQIASPDILARHFEVRPDGHRVREEVRRVCSFRHHNLIQDPPPFQQADIIMCRNVLIYFQAETVRRIVSQFASSLAPDGYLFLGPAETIWRTGAPLHAHFRNDCFVYRFAPSPESGSPATPPPSLFSPDQGQPSSPGEKPARPTPTPVSPESLHRTESTAPSARCGVDLEILRKLLDAEKPAEVIRTLDGKAESVEELYLEAAAFLALGNHDGFASARNRLLEKDPLHLPVRCLDALSLLSRSRQNEAREELGRVLFVHEGLLLPRYLLMLSWEKEGRKDRAMREARTLRDLLLSGRGARLSLPLYGAEIPDAEIQAHCNRLLAT